MVGNSLTAEIDHNFDVESTAPLSKEIHHHYSSHAANRSACSLAVSEDRWGRDSGLEERKTTAKFLHREEIVFRVNIDEKIGLKTIIFRYSTSIRRRSVVK